MGETSNGDSDGDSKGDSEGDSDGDSEDDSEGDRIPMVRPGTVWLFHDDGSAVSSGMPTPFRILDAARAVVDEVNLLADQARRSLLQEKQLRNSAQSIAANLREARGRRIGAERNQFFRYALGSAQETDEHLRSNFAARRIPADRYWRLHNRLVVVRRGIERMGPDLDSASPRTRRPKRP